MVINIRLVDRQNADSDDPLPRAWWGYDPDATPEQLWNHNRGIWALSGSRIASERWAALNYQGRIVLVAELEGPDHETFAHNRTGKPKKALIGRVLPPEHPMHEALIGKQVEYRRNPVSYDPDPEATDHHAFADPFEGAWDAPGVSGQGLQMNADVRRAIENAAQDRLMRYYHDRGWTVTDTRQKHPYDAVAVRGAERIYLEAKGTQSKGDSVIVTRNELIHAWQHPGVCVMGVWSGMRLVDGAVDPEAGAFRIFDFNPDDGQLSPRDFDWILPHDVT